MGSRIAAALPLLVSLLLLTGCTADDVTDEGPVEAADEVAAMCERIQDIQNGVVEAANAMSAAEVNADPVARATILADGLDIMIGVVRLASLPSEPAELVAGIPARRDHVVADAETDALDFRATWSSVPGDERRSAVQRIFVIGEKLMSEVEPRISASTSTELIERVRATPSCRHVIQLPPPKE